MECDGVHWCESILVHGAGFFSGVSSKATLSSFLGKFLNSYLKYSFLLIFCFFLSELFLLFFSISVFWQHILYLPNILLSFFFHFCCHILNAKSSFVLWVPSPLLENSILFLSTKMPFLLSFWLILIVFVWIFLLSIGFFSLHVSFFFFFFFISVNTFHTRWLSGMLWYLPHI